MSHLCSYCGNGFATKRSMESHKKTAKYCLQIQENQGIQTEHDEFTCNCGSKFTLKHHLKSHQKTCGSQKAENIPVDHQLNQHMTIDNSITNLTQTNLTQNVFVFGTTMDDLTPEIIMEKMASVLDHEWIEAGLTSITECAVPAVFKNENGNWIIRVTDASRNKFSTMTNRGEVPDPNGSRSTALLRPPILQLTEEVLGDKDTKEPEKLEQTIKDIKNDQLFHQTAIKALLKTAPGSFAPVKSRQELVADEAWKTALADNEKFMEEYHRKKEWKLKIRRKKNHDEFMDSCIKAGSETYWHPIKHYIIKLNSTNTDFVIIGKREEIDSKILSLTESDLKAIEELGLKDYIRVDLK